MKKRRRILWISLVTIVILALVFWNIRSRSPQIVLETEKPHYGYIANTVTATGTVQPVDTVAVGTQVSGTISKVYVDFNSQVKKGQILAELDKTILNAQVQQIVGNLQEAQSQVVYAQSTFNRQSQLYNVGAISKADYETAQNALRVAEANSKSVRSQLQAAQKNLSLADIFSPIDGTVLSRNVSEGQTVASSFNTPTLFSIAKNLTQMQVRAAVDEADIGNVKKNQRVTFTVDAFPDDIFNGTVEEIRLQPSVSANVVTYTTIINTSNDDLKLKPGMTANITVYTKEENNALIISARATKFRPDSTLMKKYTIVEQRKKPKGQQTADAPSGANENLNNGSANLRAHPLSKDSAGVKRTSVWILNGTTLTRRFIRTGLDDGTQVQVLSGLTPVDQVVDGVQQAGTKATQNSNPRSPFMPQRRGGQGSQGGQGGNRPSGGGQGGGGNRPSQ
jgi:HlyD family secretion protein